MENEKKVAAAYTVYRYEDGSVNVENAEVEGAEKLTNNQIFKDVEDVAEMIKLKRVEDASYLGIRRFYSEVQAAQEAQEQAEPQTPVVE